MDVCSLKDSSEFMSCNLIIICLQSALLPKCYNLIYYLFAVHSIAAVSAGDIGMAEVSLLHGESDTSATGLLPVSFLSCGPRSMVINLLVRLIILVPD